MPGGIKGNPEYLVELINLNDESLRDTIFYNVFKRQLLFDDLDTAIPVSYTHLTLPTSDLV